MPKLIAAAIKFKLKGCEYFQIMCGKRHCNILEMMYKLRIEYEKATAVQGFLTEDDQFVDRYDAAQMAYHNKQILPDSDLLEKMNADPRYVKCISTVFGGCMVSEELKKDIGNALAAYAYILNAAALGCQVPSQFEIFKQLEPEEVHERLSKLHEWYQQL